MTNIEKYTKAFAQAFEAQEDQVKGYTFGQTEGWDSIGHMSLVVALEDAFGVEFEPDDMLALTSYEAGLEVLKKKGIQF